MILVFVLVFIAQIVDSQVIQASPLARFFGIQDNDPEGQLAAQTLADNLNKATDLKQQYKLCDGFPFEANLGYLYSEDETQRCKQFVKHRSVFKDFIGTVFEKVEMKNNLTESEMDELKTEFWEVDAFLNNTAKRTLEAFKGSLWATTSLKPDSKKRKVMNTFCRAIGGPYDGDSKEELQRILEAIAPLYTVKID